MEKIKSLADLKRIKENVQTKIDLREKSEQVESLIQITRNRPWKSQNRGKTRSCSDM